MKIPPCLCNGSATALLNHRVTSGTWEFARLGEHRTHRAQVPWVLDQLGVAVLVPGEPRGESASFPHGDLQRANGVKSGQC